MYRNKKAMCKRGWPLLLLGVFLLLPGCASKHAKQATPGKAAAEVQPQRAIMDIDVSEDETTARVTVHANQPLTYTAVKHQFPLAVVLYFPDTALEGIEKAYTPEGSSLVSAIQTSSLKRTRPSTRIEIRLNKDVPYKVARSESDVLVLFKKDMAAPAEIAKTGNAPDVDTTETKTWEPPVQKKVSPKPTTAAPAAAAPEPDRTAKAPATGKTAVLKRIEFEVLKSGPSRLIVETDRKTTWETIKSSDKRLLIKLYNTKIPKFQKRPLITTRFDSAVDRVLPIQTEKMGKNAVLAVELREAVPYRVHEDKAGNIYMVDFDPSSVPPSATPDSEKSAWIQSMKKTTAIVSDKSLAVVKKKKEESLLLGEKKAFTGERISLDFQDADVHNIFRILHEVSGKNFVIGQNVKGRVTLKLVNVPWDQVLDLLLHMNKLGTVTDGNVVRIATLATLKAEQDALAKKRAAEEAAKDLEPLLTRYIKLNYAKASDIKSHLVEMKSNRGQVTIDAGTNIVILNDEKEFVDSALVLINQLDEANQEIATRQVLIEARIVEADSIFTRDIGVSWGGDVGRGTIGTSGGNSTLLFGGTTYTDKADATTTPNFAVSLPPSSIFGALGFSFGRIAGTTLNLDIRLMAMERQGKGRTISAPKILTLDNQEATIKQVTKIPYQVIEDGTVSIKTEDAGIELSVTPHITRDERIRMKIHAEKGAPDWSNTVSGNPAIDINTADTELFVNDGQTIVIGGILKSEDTMTQDRIPFFGNLPLFGWLFKQKLTLSDKDELLIFITPKIIRLEDSERRGG